MSHLELGKDECGQFGDLALGILFNQPLAAGIRLSHKNRSLTVFCCRCNYICHCSGFRQLPGYKNCIG